MSASGDANLLRPMNLGELFDRAITLLVRNWRTFAIVFVGFLAIPNALLTFANKTQPLLALLLLVGAVAGDVLAASTAANLVEQCYSRSEPDLRAAVSLSAGSFFPALGAFLGIVFVWLIPDLLLTAPLRAVPVAGVRSVVQAAVLTPFDLMLVFALNVAAIEPAGALSAIRNTFALFSRDLRKRTFLFASALIPFTVVGSVGYRLVLQHSLLTGFAGEFMYIIAIAFKFVAVSVFYFDVRTRREGIDIELQLDALKSPA